jgi:hypothetical protein
MTKTEATGHCGLIRRFTGKPRGNFHYEAHEDLNKANCGLVFFVSFVVEIFRRN